MFHDIKICFLHLMNSKFRLVLDWKATNVSLENIVDTDEMPQNVASHLCLHCLLRKKQSSRTDGNFQNLQ